MKTRKVDYSFRRSENESEGWSSQYIFQFKQLERRSLKNKEEAWKIQGLTAEKTNFQEFLASIPGRRSKGSLFKIVACEYSRVSWPLGAKSSENDSEND